jgi:putative tricarboxylic transport membrane protein
MKISDAIFGAVFLLVGVVVVVHVQGFPRIPGQQVGPGLFPGLVATGLAVCGLLLIVSGYRKRATEPWAETAEWMRSGRHFVAFAAIVGGVVAYVLVADAVGFLIVAPVLLWMWFSVLGVRRATAIVVAIATTIVMWYAFYRLLRVPLPWGILTPYTGPIMSLVP